MGRSTTSRKTKAQRIATGTVTVDGVTVRRTRKAQSPATKHKVAEREVMRMKQLAYELSMQFVSQQDIARTLGVSRPRVSQLLNEEFNARRALLDKTEQQWRELEVMRTEHLQSRWAMKAEGNAPAANVYLNLAERKDRLLGLNVSRHELELAGQLPPSPNATVYDLTLLDLDQLNSLEAILSIAAGVAPPEPMLPLGAIHQFTTPPAVADWGTATTRIADQGAVVATVDPPEDQSRRGQILKFHRQGMPPSEIRSTLRLTHEEFLAALENDPAQQSMIQ